MHKEKRFKNTVEKVVLEQRKRHKKGLGSALSFRRHSLDPEVLTSDSPTAPASTSRPASGLQTLLLSLCCFVFSFLVLCSVSIGVGNQLNKQVFPAVYVDGDKIDSTVGGLFFGILSADAAQARATVNDLMKAACALFAITIQITAILLQIAAQEFSSDVSSLFIRDKVLVFSNVFFTTTLCYVVFLTSCINENYVPRGEVLIAELLMLFNVMYVIPYFIYVLRMVNPLKVVNKVAESGLASATHCHSIETVQARLVRAQNRTIWAIESVAQIATTAMQNQNKTLAYSCVEVLSHFSVVYGTRKEHWRAKSAVDEAGPSWFIVPDEHRNSPDFFSLSNEAINDLEERQTWIEYKVLRRYQNMFQDALTSMCDLCYVIAVNTRQIAEAASARHDFKTWDLCTKFFNTFLRYGIVKTDTRTVYNILHQYRSVAETLVNQDLERLSVVQTKKKKMEICGTTFNKISDLENVKGNFVVNESKEIVLAAETRIITMVNYLSYYADVALQAGMSFIAETAAHDIASIAARVYLCKRECHQEVLDIFLAVHQLATDMGEEHAALGMRRAQVKLATNYLVHGADQFAKLVYSSMEHEPRPFVLRIWSDLNSVNEREFWEVNDRGINIDFLPQKQREQLDKFFSYFDLFQKDLKGFAQIRRASFKREDGHRETEYNNSRCADESDGVEQLDEISTMQRLISNSKHAAGGMRVRNTLLHPGRTRMPTRLSDTLKKSFKSIEVIQSKRMSAIADLPNATQLPGVEQPEYRKESLQMIELPDEEDIRPPAYVRMPKRTQVSPSQRTMK